MVRDIPIIFSAPMVRALLEGRKTQTRRLAWNEKRAIQFDDLSSEEEEHWDVLGYWVERVPDGVWVNPPTLWQRVKPGDRLWVREAHAILPPFDQGQPPTCIPRAGWSNAGTSTRIDKWKPAIFMPRWASRLTLKVTATKIESLQDISEADARAEGASTEMSIAPGSVNHATYRSHFGAIWSRLHGENSWAQNPEVVAITFIVRKGNIDA